MIKVFSNSSILNDDGIINKDNFKTIISDVKNILPDTQKYKYINIEIAKNINNKDLKDIDFSDCLNLQNIILHNNIFSLYDDFFNNCKSLQYIYIEEEVQIKLLAAVFKNCVSLQKFNQKGSIIKIGESAFENCVSLDFFPNITGTRSISQFAFKNCRRLKEIIIPDTVSNINDRAFENCSNLETIIFKTTGSINIHENAFACCEKIKNIQFDQTNPLIIKEIQKFLKYI